MERNRGGGAGGEGRRQKRRKKESDREEEATWRPGEEEKRRFLLDLCVSSLRRGHANLLCIVPNLTDDLFRDSVH